MKLYRHKINNSRLLHLVCVLVALAVVLQFSRVVTQIAYAVTAAGTYTWWTLPASDYTDMQWNIRPETDPTPEGWFWSHQWWIDSPEGIGGYSGLQTVGSGFGTKIAIFSIWDAVGASPSANVTGSVCLQFTGEGTGYSCRIPYKWTLNTDYKFNISKINSTTWEARVTNLASGLQSTIGRIFTPSIWGGIMKTTVNWTEYYNGPRNTCSDINYTRAFFSTPSFNQGTIFPASENSSISSADCTNSKVSTLADGVYQEEGIRQGLTGQYFASNDFTNLKITRLDPTINFDWMNGSPFSTFRDRFTVRWTGAIQAPESNLYTFCAQYEDGARVWVNNQLLVNDWTIRNNPVEQCGPINLTANQFYPIKVEYLANKGASSIKLQYSTATIVKQVIPSSQFRPQ